MYLNKMVIVDCQTRLKSLYAYTLISVYAAQLTRIAV